MRQIVTLLLAPWLALFSGALPAQKGLKIDEPGMQIALSSQTAGSTPGCAAGFYTLRVSDGGEPGFVAGAYATELQLLEPGSRMLAGGVNFGGLADALAPAFAAVNISNAANESQQIRVSLSGSRPRSSNGVRVRVALLSRAPSAVATLYSEDVMLSPGATQVRTETVQPGFYSLVVTPLDPIAGADAYLQIGLETSFVGRPGGGFQGGANFGGYHDPLAAEFSGYVAFCLGDAHTISARTFGRSTHPAFGAGDLRLRLVRDNSSAPTALLYDSQAVEPPGVVIATLRLTNELSTPLLATSLNGVSLGVVQARQTVDLAYAGPARGILRIGIARAEGLPGSEAGYFLGELLFTANGQTLPIHVRHNNLYRQIFPGSLAPVALYSPQIDNRFGEAIEARIYDGVENAEYSQRIPVGLITFVNRNLGISPSPRVYFPILPGQLARVRAIAPGGVFATVFSLSYSDLAQADSGDVIAVVTTASFLGNGTCGTPTRVLPGCVGAATVHSQRLPVHSAGQVDTIQFSLCADYDATVPNTLRIVRPTVTCSLPAPAPCPASSGLTLSSATAAGQSVIGPVAVRGNSTLAVPLSGSQGQPGQDYCVTLRQVEPWEGAFDYEFRLSGTPPQ